MDCLRFILKLYIIYLLCSCHGVLCASYTVDSAIGTGRQFDGIGGLSGGGATSKLLVNYAEPYRSQILDYLFKPNFGASLHILKVEIGGDAQSTEGTESSHMHESWDENYMRGYEWWLLVEAKRRNPNIKLYGLPWTFPGWVSQGTGDPYRYPNLTATYVVKWILGAKKIYNLDIDLIGVWNERDYSIPYIELLDDLLMSNGLESVKIVAADGGWSIADDILKDPKLAATVDFIGVHYPGTYSSNNAQKSGKPLWASEDYSTFNDNVGAGCWARILNQNYVNGYMTSTISWNLIAAYYPDLPFGRCGLMTAEEPWSGAYTVETPIWITAHTTQFTEIGWKYLKHGFGVGKLESGGSYVSLSSPDGMDFTMVIETMSHNHSYCIRPGLPPYDVMPQKATFMLRGKLRTISKLYVWYTKLGFDGKQSVLFENLPPVQVVNGQFTVSLDLDEIFTITTVSIGQKGTYPMPPPSKPFPLPYADNFDGYPEYSEAFNFGAQTGVWEIRTSSDPSHGKINRQVVLNAPIDWCTSTVPMNLGGDHSWSDVVIQLDFMIPSINGTKGVIVGSRIDNGGCGMDNMAGLYFHLLTNNSYLVTTDPLAIKVVSKGLLPGKIMANQWYTAVLAAKGTTAFGYFQKMLVFQASNLQQRHGYAGYGTTSFGLADFDNFSVQNVT